MKRRIVLIVTLLFVLACFVIFYLRNTIIMSFNEQLDNETQLIMKEKLNTRQILNISLSDKDLYNFKQQIRLDDFNFDNLGYYHSLMK